MAKGVARIRVTEVPNRLPPPPPAALDEYEASTGLRLPESYRQFVLRFGPGALSGRFPIAAPGYPAHHDEVDLARLNAAFRAWPEGQRCWWSDPERLARLVAFCNREAM